MRKSSWSKISRRHELARVIRSIALTVVVGMLVACGTTRTVVLPTPPPALFERSKPLVVESTYVVTDRHGKVVVGKASGLGTGMLRGAGGSLSAGAQSGSAVGLALGILLAPVAAVGGGIYGLFAAHPKQETQAAIAAIDRVYGDSALLDGVDTRVREHLTAAGFSDIHALSASMPEQPPGPGDRAPNVPPPGPGEVAGGNHLRMRVVYGFLTEGTYSPEMWFTIDVATIFLGPDQRHPLEEYRWLYFSPNIDFFDASAKDAARLRNELAQAQHRLAETIVNHVLVMRESRGIKLSNMKPFFSNTRWFAGDILVETESGDKLVYDHEHQLYRELEDGSARRGSVIRVPTTSEIGETRF